MPQNPATPLLLNLTFGLAMCGKGLLGRLMAETWQFQNWIARDQIKFRKERDERFAQLADRHEIAGSLIPDGEMMSLYRKTFKVTPRMNQDGIPRNPSQAREVMSHITSLGIRKVTLIHLQMTPEESMRRFMKKYNAEDRIGRKDATLEIHARRLELHAAEEEKTLRILRRHGVHIFQIDAQRPIPEKMLLVQNYLRLPEISDRQLEKIAMIEVQDKEKELQAA